MPTDRAAIVSFLGRIHLFRQLDPKQMDAVAAEFKEVLAERGKVIFTQGDPGDNFYLVFQGRVRWHRVRRGQVSREGILGTGDYFGEEALMTHRPRTATITCEEDTILLSLSDQAFHRLIRQAPQLRINLKIAMTSRRLFRQIKVNWLNQGETLYIFVRRHPFFLLRRLIITIPLFLAGLGFLLGLIWIGNPLTILYMIAGLWVVTLASLSAWQWLDWANDYFFVTDQRIVWEERIALIYSSRQESPLQTIQSVGVNTTQLGRILHYGNVGIRTFGGLITLENIGYPDAVASMVDEYWKRAWEVARKEDYLAMERSIRERLGMLPAPSNGGAKKPEIKPIVTPGLLQKFFANIFRVRYDLGDLVIYRKHPIILFRDVGLQTLLLLGIIVGFVMNLLGKLQPFPIGGLAVLLLIAFFIILGWWVYKFVDWSNDIYQVTPDQIVDIKRTPLSSEKKQSAPIDNVLSIDSERHGVLGLLLNFGTVNIKVGTANFDFKYVYDPSQVQQDIFRRKQEREATKKRRELQAERDRLADWFAVYHRGFSYKEPGEAKTGAIEAYSILGQVTVDKTKPLPGVIISEPSGKLRALTDAEGKFVLAGLFPGTYTLVPSLIEYKFTPDKIEVDLADSDFDGISIDATEVTYSISGKVTTDSNIPLIEVTISAGKEHTAEVDQDGNFTIKGLPAGHYNISPERLEYRFTPINRVVILGPNAELIDFIGRQAFYSISGRVISDEGDPLAGVLISIGGGRTATTDIEGRYLLVDLPPGPYLVTPMMADYVFTPHRKKVYLAPSKEVANFSGTRRTYRLKGRVVTPSGMPLAGVVISAGGRDTATTDLEGKFLINGMLSGTYLVRPNLSGTAFAPEERLVTLGPDQEIEFTSG